MNNDIIMTTGHQVEGYRIQRYLGVYTGESAMGTGFLSSLGAGVADFFGVNSTGYSQKLNDAKDFAMEMLKSQVLKAGGNAIIGLSLNYTAFASDIMGVVAVGTAVKVEPIEGTDNVKLDTVVNDEESKFSVKTTCGDLPFLATIVHVIPGNKEDAISLEMFSSEDIVPQHVLADIEFVSVFDEVARIENVYFTGFELVGVHKIISRETALAMSRHIGIKYVNVMIRKYVLEDRVETVEAQNMVNVDEQVAIQRKATKFAKNELLDMAQRLRDTRLMYTYSVEHKEELMIPDGLIEELREITEKEKMYGGMKREGLKAITNYPD